MKNKATVKATNEQLIVYKMKNGNYYDWDAMGENQLPTASKAGKKEFIKDELIIGEEINQL